MVNYKAVLEDLVETLNEWEDTASQEQYGINPKVYIHAEYKKRCISAILDKIKELEKKHKFYVF